MMMCLENVAKLFSVHAAPGFHCLSVGQTFISPIVTFGGWLLCCKSWNGIWKRREPLNFTRRCLVYSYPLSMCSRIKKFLFLLLRFVSSVHALHIYAIYGLVEYHLQRERFYRHLQLLLCLRLPV